MLCLIFLREILAHKNATFHTQNRYSILTKKINMKKIIFGLTVLLIYSCSPTYLVKSTKINDFTILNKEDKVMIVSMFRNQNIRSHFETQMLLDLAEEGIKSETSLYTFINPGAKKEVPKEKIEEFIQKFKEKGFNKILLTVLVDKEQHSEFQRTGLTIVTSGYPRYSGYPYNNNYTGNLYGYVGAYQPYYYSNSKVTEIKHTSYICESTLYDISSTNPSLVWVGTFKGNDVKSAVDAVDKYTKEVVAELVASK